MKKRLFKVFIAFILVCALCFSYLIWANKALQLNKCTVKSVDLPDEFNGFKILHVSDLHNDEFGKDNEKLINAIKKADADIIALTGDLLSSYDKQSMDVALAFAKNIADIAPCYYVLGNHEARYGNYTEFCASLEEYGITVLNDEKTEITYNGGVIDLIGLRDPSLYADTDTKVKMKYTLDILKSDNFSLVLSHRPEYFDVYTDASCDLVLSGHAHGGQFRVPFIGGLYAPGQGTFPEYDSGLYTEGDTNMYVSRGLGNSAFPLRINNRPEIILITLEKAA